MFSRQFERFLTSKKCSLVEEVFREAGNFKAQMNRWLVFKGREVQQGWQTKTTKKFNSRDTCLCCYVVCVTPSEHSMMGIAAGMTAGTQIPRLTYGRYRGQCGHKSQNSETPPPNLVEETTKNPKQTNKKRTNKQTNKSNKPKKL